MKLMRAAYGFIPVLALLCLPQAASAETATFYVSRLPLNKSEWNRKKESDTLRAYCSADASDELGFSDPKNLTIPGAEGAGWTLAPENLTFGNTQPVRTCSVIRTFGVSGDRMRAIYISKPKAGKCAPVKIDISKIEKEQKVYIAQLSAVAKLLVEAFKVGTENSVIKARPEEEDGSLCVASIVSDELKYSLSGGPLVVEAGGETLSIRNDNGPAQHLFWTVDLALPGAKKLTYDTSTKSLLSTHDKKDILIGLNWEIGDILTDYPLLSLNRITLKASVGNRNLAAAGLGYRLFTRGADSYSTKALVSLFVMSFWKRDDQEYGAAVRPGWQRSLRAGLSFGVGF